MIIPIDKKIRTLKKVIPLAVSYLKECCICPRNCNVNRLEDERGFCGIGRTVIVNKIKLQKEREDFLNGHGDSGMVFFTSCNLRCIYCNNYKVSQMMEGKEYTPDELADVFLKLQSNGAQNINLVSPTHVSPQIMEGLLIAYEKGLQIPIIYNTGGFDVLKMLRLWKDIIDIYVINLKYGNKKMAKQYSLAFNYPKVSQRALEEMYQQVGLLKINGDKTATQGLLIRHLVLPENQSNSELVFECIKTIHNEIQTSIYLDYQPDYRAFKISPINRKLNYLEINKLHFLVQLNGLKNVLFYN